MQIRRDKFNGKRNICPQEQLAGIDLAALVNGVRYCGNPVHKKNPGDFGLSPPSGPRPGKSLCDTAKIFEHAVATKLLQAGIKKGLISRQFNGDWPQNIWAVTDDGIALEAQLENRETGAYHGYPMQPTDPFAEKVVQQWSAHQHE